MQQQLHSRLQAVLPGALLGSNSHSSRSNRRVPTRAILPQEHQRQQQQQAQVTILHLLVDAHAATLLASSRAAPNQQGQQQLQKARRRMRTQQQGQGQQQQQQAAATSHQHNRMLLLQAQQQVLPRRLVGRHAAPGARNALLLQRQPQYLQQMPPQAMQMHAHVLNSSRSSSNSRCRTPLRHSRVSGSSSSSSSSSQTQGALLLHDAADGGSRSCSNCSNQCSS